MILMEKIVIMHEPYLKISYYLPTMMIAIIIMLSDVERHCFSSNVHRAFESSFRGSFVMFFLGLTN